MASVLQWVGLAFGLGLIAFGVMGLLWPFTAAEYPGAPFARQGRELAHLILRPSRGDRQAGVRA